MSSNDFSALENMIYSGRGITVGLTPSNYPFIGYSLTGRSHSSQARELVYEKNKKLIRTNETDSAQLKKGNPALLLYPAIAYSEGNIIASNGAQTRLILSEIKRDPSYDRSPADILMKAFSEKFHKKEIVKEGIDLTCYEPDDPNFTPRISACLFSNIAAIYIVSKTTRNEKKGDLHRRFFAPGQGTLITTYKGGNENPLLSFKGEPLNVQIGSDDPENIVDSIYAAIYGGQNPGDNYRVAAAVMMIKEEKIKVAIRNRSSLGI